MWSRVPPTLGSLKGREERGRGRQLCASSARLAQHQRWFCRPPPGALCAWQSPDTSFAHSLCQTLEPFLLGFLLGDLKLPSGSFKFLTICESPVIHTHLKLSHSDNLGCKDSRNDFEDHLKCVVFTILPEATGLFSAPGASDQALGLSPLCSYPLCSAYGHLLCLQRRMGFSSSSASSPGPSLVFRQAVRHGVHSLSPSFLLQSLPVRILLPLAQNC